MKNFLLFLFCASLISFSARAQNKLLNYKFSEVYPGDTIHDSSNNGNEGTLEGGAFLACGVCIIGRSDSDYLNVPASVINGLNDFTIEMEAVGIQRYHLTGDIPLNTLFSSSNSNCTYCFGIAYNNPDHSLEVTMHGTMHSFPYAPPLFHREITVLRKDGLVTVMSDEDVIGEFYCYAPLDASTFIFGQHEQCLGGCFNADQAFHGGIGHLQIWDGDVGQKQMDDADAQEISSSVFPNPVSSSATISFSLQQNSHATIELLDVAGRKITCPEFLGEMPLDENFSAGNHEVNFNRESLAAGIYFLRVEMNAGVMTRKVMVE